MTVAPWTIKLDPSAIATDRTELNINSGAIRTGSVDWGDAEVTAFETQEGDYGNGVAAFQLPNRTITIQLGLGMDDGAGGVTQQQARTLLQQKVGLLQREGGQVVRQRGGVTNLLPNPSFEYDTPGSAPAGWSTSNTGPVNAGAVITCQAVSSEVGDHAMRVVGNGSNASEGAWAALTGTFEAGVEYTFAIWLRGAAGGETVTVVLGSGGDLAQTAVTALTTSWQRYAITWTPTTDAVGANAAIRLVGTIAKTVYADAGIVMATDMLTVYFDGDTADARWTGTPGDSQSTTAGEPMYADIVKATLTPNDVTGETGEVELWSLVLETLPDFYGDEIALDTITVTGACAGVLQLSGSEAAIEGDYPARCRIIVTDTSGHDQNGLLWGLRSRHYDPASTAALVYQAEALTPLNGAAIAALSGASGGNVVGLTVPIANVWVPMLATNLLAGTELTHQGTYRVWARVYSATGIPRFQLVWGSGSLSVPITNDATDPIPAAAAFYLVDLGTIRLDPQPVGANAWVGAIQTQVTAASVDAKIDEIFLEPLDEAAGNLSYVALAAPSAISASKAPGTAANDAGFGSTAWSASPTTSTCALPISGISEYLKLTGFGFSIPSGATIEGIAATVTRGASLGGSIDDDRVRLVKAGTVQTTDKAAAGSWPSSPAPVVYGGSADLWGASWAPTDINNAGFGIAISALNLFVATVTATVTIVQITVTFTLASGFTVAQDAVVYASKAAEIRTEGPFRTADGTIYGPVSKQVGDLPRLPPSGTESRPVQVFVKPSRGDLSTLADSGLDGFTVQVKYRPCVLGRP